MALSEHEQRQFDLLTSGFLAENPDIAKKVKKASRTTEKDVAPPYLVWRAVQFLTYVGVVSIVVGLFIGNGMMNLLGMLMAVVGASGMFFLPKHYRYQGKNGQIPKARSPFMQRLENAWDERTKDQS